jgi:hypothetical protein
VRLNRAKVEADACGAERRNAVRHATAPFQPLGDTPSQRKAG